MSAPVIEIENLSKRYVIGGSKRRDDGLRHVIQDKLARPWRRLRGHASRVDTDGNGGAEEFWALRNVNLEVHQGDVIGIIGRNGAGKSTLLKILSRITEPTEGRVKLTGRVASLLEVGTGFHPELTGRENIFLNGAILGMRRGEIKRKFDEIVDFAGVERFLDTPVKRYSSGMYVRLAFAVAAHLEPEILIVDEVLAVGDAEFQKKCLARMEGVAKRDGRTVLFVSHNMAAVENLCRRGVFLRSGTVHFTGSQSEAISEYLISTSRTADRNLTSRTDRTGTGAVRVVGYDVRNRDGTAVESVASGQDIEVHLFFETIKGNPSNISASLQVRTRMGVPVFLQHNRFAGVDFGPLPAAGSFVCRIRDLPLPAGSYSMNFCLIADNGRGEYLDFIEDAAELVVIDGDYFGAGEVPPSTHGFCLVRADWRVEEVDPVLVDGTSEWYA